LAKEIFEWLKSIAFALVIVLIFNVFFGITTVYNTSMVPTLVEGNMVFISKIAGISHGDIITFETDITLSQTDLNTLSPIKRLFVSEETHKNLIKRVVGMPGDKVDITEGRVYVNDVLILEDYINSNTNGETHITVVPEDQFFVMGDNRLVSLDSRSEIIGLVEKDRIIGVAVFRFWPIFDMTLL
jgi:signal peptidase I